MVKACLDPCTQMESQHGQPFTSQCFVIAQCLRLF